MLAAYVTGHGFGHAVRLLQVLAEVRARAPRLPITLTGLVPEAVSRGALDGPVTLRRLACDTGVAQADALVLDVDGSAEACRAFDAGWDERLAGEVAWLRAAGARAVVADVPPLPLAAAARAGVPGLALANFSWDWIWRHLAGGRPALLAAAARAEAAYREADLLLELPFAGDLGCFRRREPVGFVARRPKVARGEARRRLGLDGRPVALASFGGVGLPGLTRTVLADGPDLRWLLPEDLGAARLEALGLAYVDVVGAVDAVVSKPGYGIVTDCLGAGTPLVYTERGDFPEYPVLVAALPALLPCAHVGNADVRAGRLEGPVRAVLGRPVPPPPDLGGAARAAERILAAL